MKDAVLTIRLPQAMRRRIEQLAAQQGRSLSSQVERLLEAALGGTGSAAEPRTAYAIRGRKPRSLSGSLAEASSSPPRARRTRAS